MKNSNTFQPLRPLTH